jgi:hypothetical protein
MPTANSDQPDAGDMRRSLIFDTLYAIGGVRMGVVQSYDQVQRVAVVQPVRRRKIFGTPQPLPVIRAPVGWWRFAGLVLVGEVQAGDEVLLVTCEREIWPWYTLGGIHDPTSERMHDPSDSIALPWISSIKRAITARQPGTFYIGREDATAGITITQGPAPGRTTIEGTGPGSIALGSAAVSPVVLHQAFTAAFGTFTGAVATAGTTWTSAGIPTAPTNGAFIGSLISATATLAGTLAAMASIKVVAE